MFKKKRIAMGGVVLVLLLVGMRYGWLLALGAGGALVLALAGLSMYHYVQAHRGLKSLRAHREKHGYAKLIAQAEALYQGGGNLTFVVLGDTRNRRRTAAALYEQAGTERPVAIFHTGDIVRHGTAREYVKNHIALLHLTGPAPMFCVPGNHERGARRDFAGFLALYGDGRFSFTVGPCHFLGFNNSKRMRVDAGDLAFVDGELAKATAARKFVFFHIPPRFFEDTFVDDGHRRGFKTNAQELHQILVRHGVEEVFMAHIHGYASTVVDGVRYTLTAGGGAPLSKRVRGEDPAYHYLVRRVTTEGVDRELVRMSSSGWVRAEG